MSCEIFFVLWGDVSGFPYFKTIIAQYMCYTFLLSDNVCITSIIMLVKNRNISIKYIVCV